MGLDRLWRDSYTEMAPQLEGFYRTTVMIMTTERKCSEGKQAPVFGSVKDTQSETLARGDSGLPLGLKLSVSGRVSGNSVSGTACGSYNTHHSNISPAIHHRSTIRFLARILAVEYGQRSSVESQRKALWSL